MRVKIVSDGTSLGTRVVDAETGEPLEWVTSAEWKLVAPGIADCTLQVRRVPVELEANARVLVDQT